MGPCIPLLLGVMTGPRLMNWLFLSTCSFIKVKYLKSNYKKPGAKWLRLQHFVLTGIPRLHFVSDGAPFQFPTRPEQSSPPCQHIWDFPRLRCITKISAEYIVKTNTTGSPDLHLPRSLWFLFRHVVTWALVLRVSLGQEFALSRWFK